MQIIQLECVCNMQIMHYMQKIVQYMQYAVLRIQYTEAQMFCTIACAGQCTEINS